MKKIKTARKVAVTALCLALLVVLSGLSSQLWSTPSTLKLTKKKKIQFAILLDTSSSMDGLIEQAKSQLWNIVNEFSKAGSDSATLSLEIAVYEYGNSGLPQEQMFIRQVTPFTADLDKVSEVLFALRTGGGDEYCGAVIQKSLDQLEWSPDREDLKVIVIAGNEPFSQGPVDYRKSCLNAAGKDVLVNTIFCGPADEGLNTGWKSGATLAEGFFTNIDQNQKIVYIETPYDKEIIALNEQLNETYIPYGSYGATAYANQSAQDANASAYGSSNTTSRVVSKANIFYNNSSWDLVDAYTSKSIDMKKLDTKDLPAKYRGMSVEKLEKEIAAQSEKREVIKKKINELNAKRILYIDNEKKKNNLDNPLEAALIKSIRKQATAKGFTFSN